MASRSERIATFQETLNMCREYPRLQEAVAHGILNQAYYSQEEHVAMCTPRSYPNPATRILSAKRSFDAAAPYARQGKKVCVLNFASAVTHGGGVTRGTTAQEESLCRISTLYPALSDEKMQRAFYAYHRTLIQDGKMGRENLDDCIYTPGVMVFREDDFECALLPEEQWFSVDVITCAAPDLRRTYDFASFNPSSEELTALFERRARRILTIAANHQADVVILGAFGCGAFLNPPEVVATAFQRALDDFNHVFETIEFAVFCTNTSSENYRAFQHIAGIKETDLPKQQDTLDASLLNIDITSVNRTIAFIQKNGWGLRDEDRHQGDFLENAAGLFGGGSGGVCAYKIFCYAMKYVRGVARTMRFRYAAAAMLCIGAKVAYLQSDIDSDHADQFSLFYRDRMNCFLSGCWADCEYFLTDFHEERYQYICEAYQKYHSIEAFTTLKILKELQWDEPRAQWLAQEMQYNRFR